MRLFIIRHGESHANARSPIRKPADLNAHLTELGQKQATLLADWMKEKLGPVDLVFASTLERAIETAGPIAEAFGLPVMQDVRLREGGYNYGDGSPIPDERLPMQKTIDFHIQPNEPFDPGVEGCETYANLKQRTAEFLDEIHDEYPESTIVLVTHGWTINAMFDVIFSSCAFRQCYFQVENTAISYLQYNEGWKLGPWYAHFLNQTPHLPFYPEGINLG
jgi:probable phosphoglycerate mutase